MQLENFYFKCEESFAKDGYGGKVDLHFPGDGTMQSVVIDIKTKDGALDGIQTWPEHHMQLAAYRHGLSLHQAKCGILFVSTKTAEARLVWIEEAELVKGMKMFNALLDYWYAKTGLLR